MSLELSEEAESAVRTQAVLEGVSVNELLTRTFAPNKAMPTEPTDPAIRVQALLARWQAEDVTPVAPPVSTLPGETPTQALFRQWREEEAHRTDEEIEAEDKLWADIEQSLLNNNRLLRMRTLP